MSNSPEAETVVAASVARPRPIRAPRIRVGAATARHLQSLDGSPHLQATSALLGATSLEPPQTFVEGSHGDGPEGLKRSAKVAEFWIDLLEGEQTDLIEEATKLKQRYAKSARHAENQTTELEALKAEKRRMLAELKWLQQSRDEAIVERRLLQEQGGKQQSAADREVQLSAKVDELESELLQERGRNAHIEESLVRIKGSYACVQQRADSMEMLILHYEDMLRCFDPRFVPISPDTNTFGENEDDASLSEAAWSDLPTSHEHTDRALSVKVARSLGLHKVKQTLLRHRRRVSNHSGQDSARTSPAGRPALTPELGRANSDGSGTARSNLDTARTSPSAIHSARSVNTDRSQSRDTRRLNLKDIQQVSARGPKSEGTEGSVAPASHDAAEESPPPRRVPRWQLRKE